MSTNKTYYPEMAVASPQSSGLGTTNYEHNEQQNMYPVNKAYLREIIDERNLGLCEMSHIRRTYPQGLFTPPVDLGGSGGPQDVVEKYIPSSENVMGPGHLNIATTYDAALNVGDSTGGLRKA